MTLDMDDLINSILASVGRIDFIKGSEIPDIDLYMDQVTTFMESRLSPSTRNPGVDKIMTKTMINNYAKNNLLPPPVKKKYTKEHLFVLVFIYYFKNVLSISDINAVLKPILDNYFGGKEEDGSVEYVYESIRKVAVELNDSIQQDLMEKFKLSEGIFDGPDKEMLNEFSFITLLSMDIYVKKLIIEKMIDGFENKKNGQDDK
jgi:hypothetical protein